jgi:two-component system cell cycle response regulator CtrA
VQYHRTLNKRSAITDLDTALERIRQLEDLLGHDFAIDPSYGLSRIEEQLLGLIYSRTHTVTKGQAFDLLYGMHRSPPEPKILDVFICKIRKKLEPTGLHITTVWGRGWYLEPGERSKLETLIMRADETEAA